jgi:uncharacterized protein (DUF4415 family)
VREKQPKLSGKSSTGRTTRRTRTDWRKVDKRTDSSIRRSIKSDPDAALELSASWIRTAKVVVPEPKEAVSIRRDRDVMEWFRGQGRGYRTRINAVLRTYVEAQR